MTESVLYHAKMTSQGEKPEKCRLDHSSCASFNGRLAKKPIFPILKRKSDMNTLANNWLQMVLAKKSWIPAFFFTNYRPIPF